MTTTKPLSSHTSCHISKERVIVRCRYTIFSVSFCFRPPPVICSTTRSTRPLTTCLCTSRSDPPTRPCSSSSSFASTPSPVSLGMTSAGTSCRPCHAQCTRQVSGSVVGRIRSPSKHADNYFYIRSNTAVLTFNTEQRYCQTDSYGCFNEGILDEHLF